MPALTHTEAIVTGPVTRTAATFAQVTGAVVTLTVTANWLVIPLCSMTNLTGAGSITQAAEVEWRHNTTRHANTRWVSLFGAFAPSVAAGGTMKGIQVIAATNGDTVELRQQRVDLDGTNTGTVETGGIALMCICLAGLIQNIDYFITEGGNSDSAEVTASGTSWVTGAAAGRIGQGAGEVPLTAPTTGDYLVVGSATGFVNGSPGTVEVSGGRLRRADTSTNLGSGEAQFFSHDVSNPTALQGNFFELDVLTLTANDQPEIQWEFNNDASGTSCGARRTRIFVLRLAALRNYAYAVNVGNIQVASAGTVEGSNGLTFDFGSSRDCLLLGAATWQTGGGNWGRGWLHQDAGDVHHPPDGRIDAVFNDGVGSGDDITVLPFGTLLAQANSVTWRLAEQTDTAANAYTLGRTRGNGGSARTVLVALDLYAVDPSFAGTCAATAAFSAAFTGTGAVAGTAAGTCTASATFTGVGAFAGSASAAATFAATIGGAGAIAASCNATGMFAATFGGLAAVSGTCIAAASYSATFTGVGAFSGSASCEATFSAAFMGAGAVLGTASCSASFTAAFTGVAAITASCTAVAAFSATFSEGALAPNMAMSLSAAASFAGTFTGIGAFGGALVADANFRWATVTANIETADLAIATHSQNTLVASAHSQNTLSIGSVAA